MEACRVLHLRTTQAAAAAAEVDFADDEETDDEDSFFDLDLNSPDSVAVARKPVAAEKDFRFIESSREFVRRNEFMNSKPLYKVTLVRSTPKFKVFMLGFRKSSKCGKLEAKWSPLHQFPKSSKIEDGNSATCRVAGGNSLRSQLLKENLDDENSPEKSSRGSLPRYLKLIRPLYLMVRKRNKVTESSTPSASPVTVPGNLSPRRMSDVSRMGSFKIAARRLGKSRSVSTAPTPGRRRDDSLLERDDGIQNAVLYCKRSFNSSSSKEFSQLFESSVNPLHHGRRSCEEPKRCSI